MTKERRVKLKTSDTKRFREFDFWDAVHCTGLEGRVGDLNHVMRALKRDGEWGPQDVSTSPSRVVPATGTAK